MMLPSCNAGLGGLTSGGDARFGLSALLLVIALPIIIGLIIALYYIYKHTFGKKLQKSIEDDWRKKVQTLERAGKFISAAAIYENNLKDREKAAELYEKGGAYQKAALMFEMLGITDKAKKLYEKAGSTGSAAELSMLEGDYEGAAKLYDKAGEKLSAAAVLERAGRRLAAARAYREAGEYKKSAYLLEEEGRVKEAAEMFGLALAGKEPDLTTIEDFYAYAYKLERAGDVQRSAEVFKMIDKVNPLYRDVADKLKHLTAQESPGEDQSPAQSLRNLIRSGSLAPKYSLKLWLQILTARQTAYSQGKGYGSLSPDTIAFNDQKNVIFLSRWSSSVYASPEERKGVAPDALSDIYSAGVILYEMLTGSLEGLGSVRVADLLEDIPDWLDEIVLKCIRKVREDRYQSIEEIVRDIKVLSKRKAES